MRSRRHDGHRHAGASTGATNGAASRSIPARALLALPLLLAGGLLAAADLVPLSPEQQRAFGIEVAPPASAEATLTRRYPGQVTVPNAQLRVVAAPRAG
jgi:hypothetical protein